MIDPNKKTDEEIVELIKNGDKELYSEIIKRYQIRLLRYADYLINDYPKATDAVQESFIKAYINLNSFKLNKKFSSWIYRIVHNEVINLVQKNKRNIPFNLIEKIDFTNEDTIEDTFSREETINKIHTCLKYMDLKYSEPLSLYYLEECSYEEISDILRLPIGTVGTRINRAKVIMRKLCQI